MNRRITITEVKSSLDLALAGKDMYALVKELYPICRSITGNGFRASLKEIANHIPIQTREVPTGTQVFDWTVPREWNIKDAYVKNSRGERVIDFKKLNLHVLNYSVPVQAAMTLSELRPHLFTIPEHPDRVPYRTSYYKEAWGFCLSHNQLQSLVDDRYEVSIDSSLEKGHLTYGEIVIHGRSDEEVLFSCHNCHPSLCNDNLSGVAIATFLAKLLSSLGLRYTYRFIFIPGTIGAITWLALNEPVVPRIKHGFVVAGGGDSGPFHYKRSRRGEAEVDRAAEVVLKHAGDSYKILPFSPYGYDERQYCSPGINLPVGVLSRTPHGQFPEYHTSADDLTFVKPENMARTLYQYLAILEVLEGNGVYLNQNQKCEPQLGKRGLYRSVGGVTSQPVNESALLWVLNLSDGTHSLLDIAEQGEMPFEIVLQAARRLEEANLLQPIESNA